MKVIIAEIEKADKPLSKRELLDVYYGDKDDMSVTAIISAVYELLDQGRIEYTKNRRLVLTRKEEKDEGS